MLSLNTPRLSNALAAALAAAAFSAAALAQPESRQTSGDDIPESIRRMADDPADPKFQAMREAIKKQKAFEQELRKFRATYFRSEFAPKRREGIEKLKATYNDPTKYQSLVSVFGEEKADVRRALLEMFRASKTDQGDRAMTWFAITDKDAAIRAGSIELLRSRVNDSGKATPGIIEVVARAATAGNEQQALAASVVAQGLGLFEVIPALIQAQFGGQNNGGGGDGERRGDLAYIFVGTQQAYVQDLTPVVSEGAVAFDQQIGYVTSGTLLRVHDAVVTVNRSVVHGALMDLGQRLTNSPLDGLGYNQDAWKDWYAKAYVPAMAQRKAESDARDAAAKAAAAQNASKSASDSSTSSSSQSSSSKSSESKSDSSKSSDSQSTKSTDSKSTDSKTTDSKSTDSKSTDTKPAPRPTAPPSPSTPPEPK